MSRDSGPALKALGRASLIISIVFFAALGIIGYSLFEETTYIINNLNNLQPNITNLSEEENIVFKVNITVPNKGVLPIHLILLGDISSNNTIIGVIKPISETINQNEEKEVIIEVPINILSIKNGNITLSVNGSVSLQPFLSLSIATSIDFSLPEFDLSISEKDIQLTSSSINQHNSSNVLIPLNIQFINKFPENIKGDLRIILTSTPKTNTSSNYGEIILKIDVDSDKEIKKNIIIVVSENIVSSGTYNFDLIFSIEQQNIVIRKEVKIECDICNE